MQFDDILTLVKKNFPDAIVEEDRDSTPAALVLEKENVKEILFFLRDHEHCYFDMLSCLTAIDNGPEENTMEIVYNLCSLPYEHQLMVKVFLDRTEPETETVSGLWKTADWHEREAYDLFGIRFTNHPDLRRILLPEDWEGHPLRKDYDLQKYYHGVKVEY